MPDAPVNTQTSLNKSIPLCVDLDGTLILTDLLLESLFALLKRNPFYLLMLPVWLLRGKAYLKHQIAVRVELDVSLLPYHPTLLAFLQQQQAVGQPLILATASHDKFAQAVAQHLGCFTQVLASDVQQNLSGENKLRALKQQLKDQPFIYAANDWVDLPIWQAAQQAILVNAPPKLRRAIQQAQIPIAQAFNAPKAGLKTYLTAMRLHQWLKNLLLFVPLLLAHQLTEWSLLAQAILAFVAFGCCASSVYLLNDLLDLAADRQHRTKCQRPLAAGLISLWHASLMIPALLLVATLLALLLPLEFSLILLGYYLTTLSYSWVFKQSALIDVLTLAALYTLRLIAGAAAVTVPVSFWLLAFSMFLFLSLALVKRYAELMQLPLETGGLIGRGYQREDLETLAQFGSASGYLAVLVLALYINSAEVKMLYQYPHLIWLLCPLLLYLISRVWLLTRRGQLDEDPVIFAIRDRRSQILLLLAVSLLWIAT